MPGASSDGFSGGNAGCYDVTNSNPTNENRHKYRGYPPPRRFLEAIPPAKVTYLKSMAEFCEMKYANICNSGRGGFD